MTRTLRYRGELVDPRFAHGRVVAVEWPSGQVGPIRLDVSTPTAELARPASSGSLAAPRQRGRPDGRAGAWPSPRTARRRGSPTARASSARSSSARSLACRLLRTPAAVAKIGSPWSRRQLKLVAPGTLALSGWEKPTAGPRAAKAIGLWLVDATTWERRLLDREIDSFRAAVGLVVGVRRNGVTAYGSDGARRYAIEEPLQLGVISTTGPYLYVPRSDGRTVVVDLASGRVLRRVAARVQPFQDIDTW